MNLHGRFRTGLVWEFCDEEEKEDDKDDDMMRMRMRMRMMMMPSSSDRPHCGLKKCVNQNLMFPGFDTCLAMCC